MKVSTLAEPAFVGRTNELSELMRFLDSMIKGEGSTVFISGEAGSGKTRLCKEFLETAKNKGITVIEGWCLNNAAIPYFPFTEAFNSLRNTNQESERVSDGQALDIKTKLSGMHAFEESKPNQFFNPQVWKDQLFINITTELLELSTRKPVILFIDDLHWADSASLALLHYISRSMVSERFLILATYRREEIVSNMGEQPHALTVELRLMGRESLYSEINLHSLSRTEVGFIAEDMLGGRINKGFEEKLSDDSQGNPLFVVESLRMMYAIGRLAVQNGRWNLTVETLDFPQKVKDVILRRFDALKTDQKRIMEIASTIGEKFDPKLVSSALSEKKMVILQALNNIAQSTLFVYNEGECYKFKHAKIREMIYNSIEPLLRKEYHLKIAECLETLDLERPPFNDIMHHYSLSSNSKKAAKYALIAGKDALSRWSNPEAIKYFSSVLQTSDSPLERETALEGLGDAYYANCNFEAAVNEYNTLAKSETPKTRLRALRKEMDAIWFKDRNPERLMALIAQAETLGSSIDRLESARVRWNKGRTVVWLGQDRLKEGLIDHEEALRVFEEEYCIPDAAMVAWPVGFCRIWLGFEEEKGISEMLRGLAMLRELGDIRGQLLAYKLNVIDGLALCGLFEEGYGFLSEVVNMAEKIGDYSTLAYGWLRLAYAPATERKFPEAISNLLKALKYSRKTDSYEWQCDIYSLIVRILVLQGDMQSARKYFNRLMEIPEEFRKTPFNLPYCLWAEGFLLAGSGQKEVADQKVKMGNEIMLKFLFPKSIGINYVTGTALAAYLEIVGRPAEAKKELQKAEKLLEIGKGRFKNANIQAKLMTFIRPKINDIFEIRLDVVNVGTSSASITEIENPLIPGLEIVSTSENCAMADDKIAFKDKAIAPMQVKTIKLSAKITKPGSCTLNFTVNYIDDEGRSRFSKPSPVMLTTQPVLAVRSPSQDSKQARLSAASESAKKIFNYLLSAFEEDCSLKMLPEEQAGWRSLLQIVKGGQVTKYSVYGQTGYGGEAIHELSRMKLVDRRFFTGHRGRGGKILKLRSSQDLKD